MEPWMELWTLLMVGLGIAVLLSVGIARVMATAPWAFKPVNIMEYWVAWTSRTEKRSPEPPRKPRLYLSGRYEDRMKLRKIIKKVLLPAGFEIQATWVWGDHGRDEWDTDLSDTATVATRDYREVISADAVVYFPSKIFGTGRNRELGAAYACQVPVVLVGKRQRTPFDWVPGINVCPNLGMLPTVLRRVLRENGFSMVSNSS